MGTARTKANNKYNSKAYDRVALQVKKGYKAELQSLAEEQGESLNSFVNKAIEERIERLNVSQEQ